MKLMELVHKGEKKKMMDYEDDESSDHLEAIDNDELDGRAKGIRGSQASEIDLEDEEKWANGVPMSVPFDVWLKGVEGVPQRLIPDEDD